MYNINESQKYYLSEKSQALKLLFYLYNIQYIYIIFSIYIIFDIYTQYNYNIQYTQYIDIFSVHIILSKKNLQR